MAASQTGIVYDLLGLTVRHIVIPDDDSELDDATHVPVGCAMLKIAAADYNAQSTTPDLVAYVVLNKGVTLNFNPLFSPVVVVTPPVIPPVVPGL